MPATLRARMALALLLGIFLIPLSTSSLRGLTHVMTCSAAVDASLVIDNTSAEVPVLGSADAINVGDPAPVSCGGLVVDLQLSETGRPDQTGVVVSIRNTSDTDWHGTVELDLDDTVVPVAIGSIDAGDSSSDTVTLHIDPDRSYDISGTLLIGP